jgi:hypothetical protein
MPTKKDNNLKVGDVVASGMKVRSAVVSWLAGKDSMIAGWLPYQALRISPEPETLEASVIGHPSYDAKTTSRDHLRIGIRYQGEHNRNIDYDDINVPQQTGVLHATGDKRFFADCTSGFGHP